MDGTRQKYEGTRGNQLVEDRLQHIGGASEELQADGAKSVVHVPSPGLYPSSSTSDHLGLSEHCGQIHPNNCRHSTASCSLLQTPNKKTHHSDECLLGATNVLESSKLPPTAKLKLDKATMTEYSSLRTRIKRDDTLLSSSRRYTDDKERFHWYDHRACTFGWGQLFCCVSLVIIDTIIVVGGYIHHDDDNIAFYMWESVFCFMAGIAGFVVKRWKQNWVIALCIAQFTVSALILGVFFAWTCLILNKFDDGPSPVHLSYVILEIAVIWLRDITLLMSVVVSVLQILMTLRYLWRKHNWEQKIPENHRQSIRKYSRRIKRMMTV